MSHLLQHADPATPLSQAPPTREKAGVEHFCLFVPQSHPKGAANPLFLALARCFSANPTPEKALAFAGGNVVLPCRLGTTGSEDLPTVEWSKEGLRPNVVFLYRNGIETFEMKNLDFEFRTSLFMREVKNGNVSLRISGVELSDAGVYRCLVIHRDKTTETTQVHLLVAAVSDPRLSVGSDENQRVTVACEATCWLPAPLIVIVDEKGNNITDTVVIRGGDATGCFTVRQTATLRTHTNRVVCRVEQPQTNQSRTAEILISGQWARSRSFEIAVFSVGVIALVCFFALCVFCGWREFAKYAERKQQTQRISLDHQLTGVTCEGTLLLNPPTMTDKIDNTANETIVNLRKELADLKSENCQKDKTIRELLGKIQSMAVVPQHDQPRNSPQSSLDSPQPFGSSDHNSENGALLNNHVTKQGSLKLPHPVNLSKRNSLKQEAQTQSRNLSPGQAKHKNVRNHSCPAVLISFTSAPAVHRDEKTDLPPRRVLHTNPGRSVQRRHSFGPLPSLQSQNIYTPLPHLPEQ
ncbi:CD276 antigen homolog [Anableps anableps]